MSTPCFQYDTVRRIFRQPIFRQRVSLDGGFTGRLSLVLPRNGFGSIGWPEDLPGVNAREYTSHELLESLRIGAEGMPDVKGIPELDVEIRVRPIAELDRVRLFGPFILDRGARWRLW
jgi:hypothetical protein